MASGPIDASGSLALGGANEIIAVLDLGGAIPEGLWCAALDVAVNEGPLAEIHRDDVRAGGATRLRLTASLDEATADQESEPLSAVQARGRVRLTRGACPLPGEDRRPEFVVDLAPVCAQRLLSGAWFPCR